MAAPSCQGVYLIQSCNPRGGLVFKLGRSDHVRRRMKEYGPTWEILCCFPTDESRHLEKFLIARFRSELKIYANNEYFETTYSSSSIMKFFMDSVRFYIPACPGSLSKPLDIPKPEEKEKTAPPPRTNPRRVKIKIKNPELKPNHAPILTPLHEIKIHLLNPEWPNMWKCCKKDFARFVDEVVYRLNKGTLDAKYVKEGVWDFLYPMSVKKSETNDICKSIQTMDPKIISRKVMDELKQ